MGITIGPVDWWMGTIEAIRPLAINCPLGTALPDGSRVFCRAGGTAWIVAPSNTQVNQSWYDGSTAFTVGNRPCVSDWSTLNTRLISCGFNPSDWFVPNASQLQSGYNCRFFWDSVPLGQVSFWSSTEQSGFNACFVAFCNAGTIVSFTKAQGFCVRAFRCVTY